MDKTEKRTAEELLAHTLNVKVETILLNPDATITNSEAIEFAKVFTAQELDAYKMKVQQEIKTAYDEMIRIGNIKRDLNVFAIMHQLQIKLK